jgi:hypothetical protein
MTSTTTETTQGSSKLQSSWRHSRKPLVAQQGRSIPPTIHSSQPFAWSLCDQILHGSFSREVYYFAANTIHSKVQHSFLELPKEAREDFKASLFAHLQRFGADMPEVFVQLSVAVADTALYMDEWPNAATDLIQSFGLLANKYRFTHQALKDPSISCFSTFYWPCLRRCTTSI